MRPRHAALPFLTIGIALVTIGATGNNRTFLYAGIPFLLIAIVTLLRSRH
jgi:hypothetical protein